MPSLENWEWGLKDLLLACQLPLCVHVQYMYNVFPGSLFQYVEVHTINWINIIVIVDKYSVYRQVLWKFV